MRADGRRADQLRPVKIVPGFVQMPPGSALIEMGQTRLVCTASVENRLPHWLHQSQLGSTVKGGWITAEYSILPGAGPNRTPRETTTGRKSGRTFEIQRMIGRSFRSVVDLSRLGTRTIWVDCDVIQADGGTRSAAVTGGFVALVQALAALKKEGIIDKSPLKEYVAAVSVGIRKGEILLDLNYEEDNEIDVDLNVVMSEGGKLVEIQGTAEKISFSREQLAEMLDFAGKAIKKLVSIQKSVLDYPID